MFSAGLGILSHRVNTQVLCAYCHNLLRKWRYGIPLLRWSFPARRARDKTKS